MQARLRGEADRCLRAGGRDRWAAWVEEIPGVHTQGDTLEEARENLKDAFRMVLDANRELSEKAHEATRRETLVMD